MSNSIWKTREEKPKSFSFILEHYKSYDFDNNKDINTYNVFETGGNPQNPFDGNTIRWCYVDDLIAQADKAERLQKAVDNSREKLAAFMHDVWGNWFAYQLNNSTVENLQRWGIQSNTSYSSLTETDKDKDRKFADQIIEIIKDEIKQLIKGE